VHLAALDYVIKFNAPEHYICILQSPWGGGIIDITKIKQKIRAERKTSALFIPKIIMNEVIV